MHPSHFNPSGGRVVNCDDEPSCERVNCTVCLQEIPLDGAQSVDVQDYVQYFCGLDCLAVWRRQTRPPKTKNPL